MKIRSLSFSWVVVVMRLIERILTLYSPLTTRLSLNNLFDGRTRPILQSGADCGITGGGEEECWWDCNIVPARGLVITNPLCLLDCFPTGHCVWGLLRDLWSAGGICKDSYSERIHPGLFKTSSSVTCQFDSQKKIVRGVCSRNTEKKLKKRRSCLYHVYSKINIIYNSIRRLVRSSCSDSVFKRWKNFETGTVNPITRQRLNPETNVITVKNVTIQTELEYRHTRHRYPWLCSLRSRGLSSSHLCAVTLLSLPPSPTVIVTAAHCTLLCKSDGRTVPNCCCPNVGDLDCSTDRSRCGSRPRVEDINESDAEIVCGDWDTGDGGGPSSEDFNVVIPILTVKRHPAFRIVRGSRSSQYVQNDLGKD